MMTAAAAQRVFDEEHEVASPYMSFAPRLRAEIRGQAEAIYHFDGTARVQTVPTRTAHAAAWLHALLTAVV